MREIDIVTVYHRDSYLAMTENLCAQVDCHEHGRFNWIGVDNRDNNRGFAMGCNEGARQGDAPVIGLLNPDCTVSGPFLDRVLGVFEGSTDVVITGCRFDKPDFEIRTWGVRDWVCGAAMFVRRSFWEQVSGFDEQFVWGWEESDMIRTAQIMGFAVKSIDLPIKHSSPDVDLLQDVNYKHYYFELGAQRYKEKWGWR